MAEFYSSITPVDPTFQPTTEAIKKARALLFKTIDFIEEDEVRIKQTTLPKFYTSIDALESFTCPKCFKTIKYNNFSPDDPDKSSHDFSNFILEAIKAPDATKHVLLVPCCGRQLALNKLLFKDNLNKNNAAIGVFNMRVADRDGYLLDDKLRKKIENILGCHVNLITEVHT